MAEAKKINTIVVDDQMSMRSLIRTGLQQVGIIDVREYGTGEEAFNAMKAQPPHLIISDFNMPGWDGLTLLRTLRANPATRNCGFILLTGRADVDLVKRAIQFGANNYMVKPFTVATLKGKIEQIFGALS